MDHNCLVPIDDPTCWRSPVSILPLQMLHLRPCCSLEMQLTFPERGTSFVLCFTGVGVSVVCAIHDRQVSLSLSAQSLLFFM
jgi:hypothetical protein